MFSCFDTVQKCERQTDGQMDLVQRNIMRGDTRHRRKQEGLGWGE